MTELVGRRLPDTRFGEVPAEEIRAGDYWKILAFDGTPRLSGDASNLEGTCWFVAAPMPDGSFALGRLEHHTVREHDDGTISIRPGDGSSNSILVTRGERSWHGYIEHGVWRPV